MMKRTISSLFMISLTIAAVSSATVAYFNATSINTGNTFSVGTVSLGNTQGLPLSFTNLTPGEERISSILAVNYTGSLPADLYFGIKHENGDDLKNILKVKIEKMRWKGSNWESDGFINDNWIEVSNLFEQWTKFAENVTGGSWRGVKVYLQVDPTADNTYQGKSVTNTIFIHAVQERQAAPATPPYLYNP